MKENISKYINWDMFYQNKTGNQYPEAHIVRFIACNYYGVKDRSKINILDLGCGAGPHLWYLAREGFNVYGIDGSQTAIDKAKNRLDKDGLKCDLLAADFLNLPYKGESMDAVIDAASIQHNAMESIKIIILEILRVLKEGGKYFGTLIAEHKDLSDASFKTHFSSKKEIHGLFSKFKNVKIDYSQYSEDNQEKYIKFWLVEAQK